MDESRKLLSEGLDLCVRARRMDARQRRDDELVASSDPEGWQASGAFDRHVARNNIKRPHVPIATRSGSVYLWEQEQYEKDLAEWEARARNYFQANPL